MDNIRFLQGESRTPAQIVEFMKNGAAFRRFDRVLDEVYPGPDLESRLIQGMVTISGEPRDSVARKVQNWLKGNNIPQNRETLFQICFALGLDEKKASRVLGAASDTGIHYRNQKELVYAYGLRTGMGYEEAVRLEEETEKRYPVKPHEKEQKSKQKREQKNGQAKNERLYTRQLEERFSFVSDEEGLMRFFKEHGEDLGVLHETAYEKFMELLSLLQKPEDFNGEKEQKYAMKEVAEDYLRLHIPMTRRTADYTVLQKMIKKYWPSESSLLNMKNRRQDVSRKAMILLYLVTEEIDEPEDKAGYFWAEEEEDADTVLEVRLTKMELFLNRYGMNRLDPENPFDFLVIYAMRTEKDEKMSDKMAAVLDSLFE